MNTLRRSQIIKQRVVRHNRLMKLIKTYHPTEEEVKKLEKIKSNTMMEIHMRFMKSQHNRHYKFPLAIIENDSESQQEQTDSFLNRRENILYDLRTQNQLLPSKSVPQKILSLDSTRKVASLEVDRNGYQRQRLLRLHIKSTKQLSSKNLTRKNSIADRVKKEGSNIKLPQLKIEKMKEHLKTEARTTEEENDLHEVVGKKLVTQASDSPIKLRGVEKYLKRLEERQKQSETKTQFRKRVFLPDKL